MQIAIKGIRGNLLADTFNLTITCYNSTQDWINLTLEKTVFSYYTYADASKCRAPIAYSQQFTITADSEDDSNNTATDNLQLITVTAPTSGGDTPSETGSSNLGSLPPINTETLVYLNNNTNATKDFNFNMTATKPIMQGYDITLIGTIENTGNFDLNITLSYIKDCCDITAQKTFEINSKNTYDFKINIHVPLSEKIKEQIITFIADSDGLEKTYTISFDILENPDITYFENLNQTISTLQSEIKELNKEGLSTAYLEDRLKTMEDLTTLATSLIQNDNLAELTTAADNARSTEQYIETEVENKKLIKSILQNKEKIIVSIITIIIIVYATIYFIIPYIELQKELNRFKAKEIEFKDAEKEINKQYFKRIINETTFQKLISEKHEQLLTTRAHTTQLKQKITLLKKGKLDTKETVHNKYFTLHRSTKKENETPIIPKDKTLTEIPLQTLREQEEKINEILTTAEQKYSKNLISQYEYDITRNVNRKRLNYILNEINTHTQQQETINVPTQKSQSELIKKITDKYTLYKINKKDKRIKDKILKLKEKEESLEKKDKKIKEKEQNIEKEINTLKNQDKDLNDRNTQSKPL